jgi:transposase InsO family protein
MRYAAAEKFEIIRLVEQSSLSVQRSLVQLGIPRSTFYCWYDRYRAGQADGLEDRTPVPRRVWNKLPAAVTGALLELALKQPQLSPRELAVSFLDRHQYFVSEASVYRLLKAHDLITSPAFILVKAADRFAEPTTAPNQLWQTDFTYLKVIGWGWFYLSTVLDDFSRYILAWKLCTSMTATDVADTLELALRSARLERVRVRHQPRLLSDNGPSYLSAQLGAWLAEHGITHTRGAPYHPMTQGKIERYHRSLKNQILLENYYLPGQLEVRLAEFIDYYNSRRYHESLNNLTPADVYFGRGLTILTRRENTKLKTIELRRRLHYTTAATTSTQMGQILS